MRACVFGRRSGAMGLGHVGWAFEQGSGVFYAGAVENPSGSPIAHPDEIGFWSVKTKDPVGQMKARDYDSYKIVNIDRGNHARAWSKVLQVKKSWYVLLGGNCMDDTYNVLKEYGVNDMPWPSTSITPNNWYDNLNWSEYFITVVRSKDSLGSENGLELEFHGIDSPEELSDTPYE